MSVRATGTVPTSLPTTGRRTRPAGGGRTAESRITSAAVWREIARHSFAVLGHVNPAGDPRSSGVCYALVGHRLYMVVAADSLKARQVATGDQVSVTVPVRRGGILSLLFPIPPATITFHAQAFVHPAGSAEIASLPKELRRLLPEEARASSYVIELLPEGQFLTYGLGVSLLEMREPAIARAHLPVAS
jgi:Pyridoxamine 5'-phosphate oxidase